MFPIILTILTVAANIFLGLMILRRNSHNLTNVIFGTLTIIISAWTILNYFSLSTLDPPSVLFWIRLVMISVAAMFANIYLLAVVFPVGEGQITKVKFAFVFASTLAVCLLAGTPLVFSYVEIANGMASPVPGPAISVYGLQLFGYLLLTIITLLRKRKSVSPIYLPQVRLMLIGLGLTFFMAFLTTFLFVVILHNTNFVIFGPVYTLFFIGCVAYAIIKHKLLDISSLVARTVSYTLLLGLVVLLEAAIVYTGTQFLPANFNQSLVAIAGSLFIVGSYSTLNSLITRATDKIFFQGRYDSEDVLKKLTGIMVQEMDIHKLSAKLLKVIVSDVKLAGAAFVLVTNHEIISTHRNGINDSVNLHNPDIEKLLHRSRKAIIFEDLEDEGEKELFRSLKIAIIIPLIVKEAEVGLLLLAPKASGEIYAQRDLEFFDIFAPQAAIALKNAESYREIQEFTKTLESKVAERTKELQVAQEAELKLKDEFVFIATHDLATPVTAISGFSAMINSRHEKMSTELERNLVAITEASNRLRVLVNDLLQVARSDSGTIKVELKEIDIAPILEAAIRQVTPLIKEKKIKINLELAKSNLVKADAKKITEVFENLISNAVKYNKVGGSLDITTSVLNKKFVLEFKDTGFGIPESEQGKVFTKFFRSEEPEVRQRPGTGLGLFVVRMLVEKMNGKIAFESKEGKGTTFWLFFPR